LCPGHDPWVGADGAGGDTGSQYQSVKASKPTKRHVYLAGSERCAGVDHRFFKGQALAFVDGDGPGQPDRVLAESAQLFFLDLVLLAVVGVADILPGFFFQDERIVFVGES